MEPAAAILKIFDSLLDSAGQDTLTNPDRIALINQTFFYAYNVIEDHEVVDQLELALRRRVIDVYRVESGKDVPGTDLAALLAEIIQSILQRDPNVPEDYDYKVMYDRIATMKLSDLRDATMSNLTRFVKT